jgi:hypothetical protein
VQHRVDGLGGLCFHEVFRRAVRDAQGDAPEGDIFERHGLVVEDVAEDGARCERGEAVPCRGGFVLERAPALSRIVGPEGEHVRELGALILEERAVGRAEPAQVDLAVEKTQVQRIVEEREAFGDRATACGKHREDRRHDAVEADALRSLGVVELHIHDFHGARHHVSQRLQATARKRPATKEIEADGGARRADSEKGRAPEERGRGACERWREVLGDGEAGRHRREPRLQLAMAGPDVVELDEGASDAERHEDRRMRDVFPAPIAPRRWTPRAKASDGRENGAPVRTFVPR